MMKNLFSVFGPTSSMVFSIYHLIESAIHSTYWLMPSRYQIFWNSIVFINFA